MNSSGNFLGIQGSLITVPQRKRLAHLVFQLRNLYSIQALYDIQASTWNFVIFQAKSLAELIYFKTRLSISQLNWTRVFHSATIKTIFKQSYFIYMLILREFQSKYVTTKSLIIKVSIVSTLLSRFERIFLMDIKTISCKFAFYIRNHHVFEWFGFSVSIRESGKEDLVLDRAD